jgi:protein-L-isoaspartate O-methyltransferase
MRNGTTQAANVLRAAMVSALRESGHLSDDRLIDAFSEAPRHNFVPRFLVQTSDGTREMCAPTQLHLID